MKIWLITVGEPLPLADSRDRPLRTGLLAETLAERGHEVIWWTSTVDHVRKARFVAGEPRVQSRPGVTLRFLNGCLYRRNVSIRRIVNHVQIGRRFAALARSESRPDVILCSFPTIELSRAAVACGREMDVPVVLDVRDLWPDIFVGSLPRPLRGLEALLLSRWFAETAAAFAACDAIFAVSEGYLEWGLAKARRQRRPADAVHPLGYRITGWTESDEKALNVRLAQSGAQSSAGLVSFVGSFGRTYDLRTVIDAARLIAARMPGRVTFALCGAGERDEEWRRAADGIPGIVFTGWLPAGELACLLGKSAIGLAAYAANAPQGVPNKVIEYLAAGLPALCTLEGESRELLEASGAGRYFSAGDSAALADAIVAIMENDTLRRSMADAARKLFASRFAASAVYGAMADQLEAIANRQAAGSGVSAPHASRAQDDWGAHAD